ncbi:cytochrome bc complex cytochrome b subunit [bacterium]|jgi:ubiquinol-cytochrome c reductase cytochrome b subunit|nr:cytochrome bc complex cytochrome b subunit [bacterium]NBX72286.1 cytochrome bc complex cytochrome b subunit [bacterium]
MSTTNDKTSTGLVAWLDERLPFSAFLNKHLLEYKAPKNFNFWYYFGSLALFVLINQIVTGIWLAMFYKPMATEAFNSVEYIMRDVNYGWLIRYMHSTGASFFFIVIYLHMTRAFLYGSYKKPRELVWLLGCFMFVLLIAEAFFGYLLPWGQMSFWGAKVITSLFEAIPYIGTALAEFIRGDFTVSDVVLNRFFSLHVAAIPMLFLGLVIFHLAALHHVGSNNPDGIETKNLVDEHNKPLDVVNFHPYYTVKDIFGFSVFLLIFFAFIFFQPEGFGLFLEAPNFLQADPLVTPEHIAPVWYMTPFYAILRAVPSKLGGVMAMFSAIGVLFFMPWLDRCPVKSIRYRGFIHKVMLSLFIASFLILGYLGTVPATPTLTIVARIAAIFYFSFFILLPLYSKYEKTKPVPTRLTRSH